jgi:hypothetical protein
MGLLTDLVLNKEKIPEIYKEDNNLESAFIAGMATAILFFEYNTIKGHLRRDKDGNLFLYRKYHPYDIIKHTDAVLLPKELFPEVIEADGYVKVEILLDYDNKQLDKLTKRL